MESTINPPYDPPRGYVLILDMGDGRKAWMSPIVLKEMGLECARVEALKALTRDPYINNQRIAS